MLLEFFPEIPARLPHGAGGRRGGEPRAFPRNHGELPGPFAASRAPRGRSPRFPERKGRRARRRHHERQPRLFGRTGRGGSCRHRPCPQLLRTGDIQPVPGSRPADQCPRDEEHHRVCPANEAPGARAHQQVLRRRNAVRRGPGGRTPDRLLPAARPGGPGVLGGKGDRGLRTPRGAGARRGGGQVAGGCLPGSRPKAVRRGRPRSGRRAVAIAGHCP